MSGLIISVSGLRGIVGENLTPEVAMRFVAAFSSQMPTGPIIVGRDGRTSGPMLSRAIIASLEACGRDCVDVDVVATPTLGVLVCERRAAGVVQISASHNPPPTTASSCLAAPDAFWTQRPVARFGRPISAAIRGGLPSTKSGW